MGKCTSKRSFKEGIRVERYFGLESDIQIFSESNVFKIRSGVFNKLCFDIVLDYKV